MLTGRNAGVDLRPLMQPGVEVLGEVPDIRPYVNEATVVAVPIRIGGGTRFKVLEGLAMPREEDEFRLSYYNSMTTWIDIDQLLTSFGLTRDDLLALLA